MRVLYAGCNLFGQVTHSPEISFDDFREFSVENLRRFVIGHSVNVVQTGNGVYLYGHGLEPRTTHTVTPVKLPFEGVPADVSACDTRIFFVSQLGELYALDFLDKDVEVRHKPNIIFGDNKIAKFVCGIGIYAALCDDGAVYHVPDRLEFAGAEQISAGNEHCLILDKAGRVYSFGKGRRGQLGHGELSDEKSPRLIEALSGIRIVKVSTGCWHSCVLSQDGDVYVWGWNSDGQLGILECVDEVKIEENFCANDELPKKKVSVIPIPSLMQHDFGDKKVEHVACGGRHTVLITEDKEVYGCGCNQFNQLGLKAQKAYHSLVKIHQIKNGELYDLVCGPSATAILLQ